MALLPTFVVAVVLISASPGPAMALILRRAAVRGFLILRVVGAAVLVYLGARVAATSR